MRNFLKRYKVYFLAISLLSILNSCEDTMLNNMIDDQVYLLKPGLNEVQVFNFEKAVAEVVVIKSGIGQRTSQLKLEVSPSALSAYNSANGTNYRPLPASVYSLVSPTLDFRVDGYKSAFEFVIDDEQFLTEQANNPEATYVIPCEVTNLNPGKNDSTKMQTLLVPRLVEPYISFSKAGFLTDVISITSKSEDKLYFDNKIEINYPASEDVSYKLSIPSNSAELIAQYNLENGSNYVIFPAGALELQDNSSIKKGVNYGDFSYQILKNKLADGNNQLQYGKYILPLVIEQVSQNKIHPTNNVVLIPFNYHE